MLHQEVKVTSSRLAPYIEYGAKKAAFLGQNRGLQIQVKLKVAGLFAGS